MLKPSKRCTLWQSSVAAENMNRASGASVQTKDGERATVTEGCVRVKGINVGSGVCMFGSNHRKVASAKLK